MKMDEKQYRSDAFAAVHETAEGLYEIGAVSKADMREFDALCLEPVVEFKGDDILALREREHVSQSVFAQYLNVTENVVSNWECNVEKPEGPVLRLLTLVRKHGLTFLA